MVTRAGVTVMVTWTPGLGSWALVQDPVHWGYYWVSVSIQRTVLQKKNEDTYVTLKYNCLLFCPIQQEREERGAGQGSGGDAPLE